MKKVIKIGLTLFLVVFIVLLSIVQVFARTTYVISTDQTGSTSSHYGGKYDLSANHDVNMYYKDQTKCDEIIQACYQEFLSWGMTPKGAAAICGNIACESGGDPTITENWCDWSNFRFGVTGIGLMGFTYWTIQVDLFNIAAETNRKWTDLAVQLKLIQNFIGPDLKEEGKEFYTEGYDVGTLANLFCAEYERPAINNFDARTSAANKYYNMFKDLPAKSYTGDLSAVDGNSSDLVSTLSAEITKEWDLKGMPTKSGLTLDLKIPTLASRNDLTISEQYNLAQIGSDISLTNHFNAWTTVRTVIVFIGLVLMVYAIFLLIAVLFDNWNSFLNISLVRVLTLGAINYSKDIDAVIDEDNVDKVKGKKYTSTKRMVVLIVVMFVFACILISGGLIPIIIQSIYRCVESINSWL